MSYQVLARKWRPKNFAEVAGQEHVLRALTNALIQSRLHHAYLFTGTRGVGKTTIARILAKCFNCECGVTSSPCGVCDACVEIDSGRFVDLIEVDAASRTKVEDTRDLLDNVQYLPAKGKFKIYIIDEVHMLSGHSFNALLKTLEEPPAHVKFLLATTDPQKLPITVLSRCLQFNLKALSPVIIQKHLQYVLEQEAIEFESEALAMLAKAATGSVRDSLSLLDQAIAFGKNKINVVDVSMMLGTIDKEKVFALLEALVAKDAKAILLIVTQLFELSADFMDVVDELLEILQQIAWIQVVPNDSRFQEYDPTHKIWQLASNLTAEEVQLYYQIALIGKRDLALAPNATVGFEMIMLRMLSFRPLEEKLEKKLKEDVQEKIESKIESKIEKKVEKTVENKVEEVIKPEDVLKKIKVSGPTQALLQYCTVSKIEQDIVHILLEEKQAIWLNKRHEERISEALSQYYNKPMKINIIISSAPKTESVQKIDQVIEQDPKVKELMNKFDARIISQSTKT